MFVSAGGTRLHDWFFISISDHETSEYRVLPAGDPFAEPKVVSPAKPGCNTTSRKAATSSSS